MDKKTNTVWKPLPWTLLLVTIIVILIRTGNRSLAAAPQLAGEHPITPQDDPAPVPLIPQDFDLVAVRGDEPYDIAISSDGSRAYVPARNTDNLFVIDLAADQVIAVVDLYPEAEHPLGPAPERVALTPDGSCLLITHGNDESLTLLDTTALTVTRTLRFDQRPGDVAVAPDGSVAYVSVNAPDAIVRVIDISAAAVLTSTPRGSYSGSPGPIAFSPDGDQAYVALSTMTTGSVVILDPTTHTVSDTIPVPGGEMLGDDLVINHDGTAGYVSVRSSGKVFALDLVNKGVTRTFDVAQAEGLALNADGSRLYVGTFGWAGESNYNLWMFDTETGSALGGVNFVHAAPYGRQGSDIQGLSLTPDGSLLYAASVDADGVFVVDPLTLEPHGMIPTQAIASFLPLRAVLSPDGASLYVGGGTQAPATVSIIDTATLEVTGELRDDRTGSCQASSSGLALSPDGNTLYVLSSDCNELLVFDTASRTLLDTLGVGTSEHTLTHIAVHPDGDPVYVLDLAGDVHVVDPAPLQVTETLTTGVAYAWTIKLAPGAARGYITGAYGYAVLDLTPLTVVRQEDYCSAYESFCYVHGRPLGITPDAAQYLVGEFFTLHVYNAATHAQTALIDLIDWNPHRTLIRDLIFSPDGSRGYAAMWDEKAVIAFDTTTWEATARVDTGRAPYFGVCPTWLVLSADGGRLYVMAEESDNVVVIDTATETVVGTIRVGHPYALFLPVTLKNAAPPTIIAGTVTDAAGIPLAGVQVNAGPYDTIRNCGFDGFDATTAADGSYDLTVTPGSYLVYINSHAYPGGHIPEAYPNVNSWANIDAAARIDVNTGQRVASIDLSLPSGFTLSGRLVDGAGQPILSAGGNIQDDAQEIEFGCALGFGTSNTDGTFRVNVPAGTYDLNFCKANTCHTVVRGRSVSAPVDLGDVRFAEAP